MHRSGKLHRCPRRFRCRYASIAAIIAVCVAASPALVTPADALTSEEIDTGAKRATAMLRAATARLAEKASAGRDNDTPQSVSVQKYLIGRLSRIGAGLGTGEGDAAYRQPFVQAGQAGTNLFAWIPGRELPNEYVIVGAHYDHLDSRSGPDGHCYSTSAPGGEICNGATDNATGVAAVLAIGNAIRRLPTAPRRSVVLALWDAEEDGLLGSQYYVDHPLVPLGSTVAYVNFDIMGADLLPSLRTTSFAIGAETGGPLLESVVTSAVMAEDLETRPLSYIFGQLRSDYANFVARAVPTVFFSDATGGCYHTPGDDLRIVNFRKLREQSQIAFRTTVALAEQAERPAFVAPNPQLAAYEDALSLDETLGTAVTDAGLFSTGDAGVLRTAADNVRRVVAEGPAAFDGGDVGTVLVAALDTLGALERLGCRKF